MARTILLAEFSFNGTIIKDISAVKENEVELGKEVEFVDHTGYAKLPRKYGFSIIYKPPVTGRINIAEQDYDGDNVTFTIYYEGGGVRTYHGIHPLKEGGNDIDGKTELSNEYSFHADRRVGP